VLLVRALVGLVFLTEGLQKFLYPAELGSGRFAKIGLPMADLLGPFVGAVEMLCGLLVTLGLFTRLAAIPLIGVMLVALFTIKVPIALGHGFWGLSLRPLPRYGLLMALHEARTDLSMLLCSIFLVRVGAGPRSLDATLSRRSGGAPDA
jgi:uncharacterized membrane protein YphA (DoxX/SURF4 family)